MKKHLVVNTLAFLVFIVSEAFLIRCGDWADTYSLGAEMVLGMLIPVILTLFICFVIFSVFVSLYRAFAAKDIKQIVPALVLIALVATYIALSTQDSFWVSAFEFYKGYGLD